MTLVGAREARCGAVLLVEDAGWTGAEVTERLGAALYGRLLEAGSYARVRTVVGRATDAGGRSAPLAAAVVELAAEADAIDVFCSVHTTTRAPVELQRLIPREVAAKLRLVYSTACRGASEERAAWAALGARTVVTHEGLNDPLFAMPIVLGGWVEGEPIGALAARGYTETLLWTHLAQAVPGVRRLFPPGFDARGSRPVVTGDAGLTIGAPRPLPAELRVDPRRGGPLGLALRALVGRFSAGRAEVEALRARARLPDTLATRGLAQVERLATGPGPDGGGQLELTLAREVVLPVGPPGVRLRLAPRVTLVPGEADPRTGRLVLEATGVRAEWRFVDARVTRLELAPDPRGGHQLTVSAAVYGLVPLSRTLRLGGATPEPLRAHDEPRLEAAPAL